VHCCCASDEKAKLEVVEIIETRVAKPRARLVSRILAVRDLVFRDVLFSKVVI
jgi:hypothetical protein